jgi:hypothetical protein
MRVEIKKLTSWKDCLESARFTQGKFNKVEKEPSDKWKIKALYSEHSPIRELKFHIDVFDVPNFVITHLVRHIHIQPYVSTMREDLTGIPNSEITRNTPNHARFSLNAQSIIDMAKLRTCSKASLETRQLFSKIKEELRNIGETHLADVAVKSCVYRGFCQEDKCCGYDKTDDFKEKREKYVNKIKEVVDK